MSSDIYLKLKKECNIEELNKSLRKWSFNIEVQLLEADPKKTYNVGRLLYPIVILGVNKEMEDTIIENTIDGKFHDRKEFGDDLMKNIQNNTKGNESDNNDFER